MVVAVQREMRDDEVAGQASSIATDELVADVFFQLFLGKSGDIVPNSLRGVSFVCPCGTVIFMNERMPGGGG